MSTAWRLYLYFVRAAIRDRLFWSVAAAIVVVFSLAYFFGSTTVNEGPNFAIVFTAFGARFFGVVSLVLFTINYIRRSFEARDIDYLLSRPIGRVGFVLTHAAAFSTLAIITAFLLGGLVVYLERSNLTSGIMLWWFSIGVEFIIMVNVAMFFAFVMKSPTSCSLIVFAFYLLTRVIGQIHGIINQSEGYGLVRVASKTMEFISIFLPRLDLFGQTKWVLYQVPDTVSYGFIASQGLIFSAVVICAAIIDMKRRQF
jgi:hypothetical protein